MFTGEQIMTTIVAYKNTLMTDTHLTSVATEETPRDISHLYEDQTIYSTMVELWEKHGWLDDNRQVKMKYGHKGIAFKSDNFRIKGDVICKIAVAGNLVFLPAIEMITLPEKGIVDENIILNFLNEFSKEIMEVSKRTIQEGVMTSFDENMLPFIINSQFILIGDKENYVISPSYFNELGNYVIHRYQNSKEKVLACGSGMMLLECDSMEEFITRNTDGAYIVNDGQPIDEYPDDNHNPESAIYCELANYIEEASEVDTMTNAIVKEVR